MLRPCRGMWSTGLLVPKQPWGFVPENTRGMRLSPREIDHLRLHDAGFLAQKRLARAPALMRCVG